MRFALGDIAHQIRVLNELIRYGLSRPARC